MSDTRTPQNWDQPNDLYSSLNELFWGSLDTQEEDLSPSTKEFLDNNESLQQALNPETYDDSGYQELSAAATDISTHLESLTFDETPKEGGATNWQWDWQSKDVAGNPIEVHGMQLETPTPSSSSTMAGLGEQTKKRKRKREESPGTCDECEEKFVRKSDAKRHKTTVHESKGTFICEECSVKPFSRKDALQRHMKRKHDG